MQGATAAVRSESQPPPPSSFPSSSSSSSNRTTIVRSNQSALSHSHSSRSGGGAANGSSKPHKKSSVALPPPRSDPVPITRAPSPSAALPPLPLSLVTASSPSSSTAHWRAREMVSSFADPSAEDMDKSDMQRTVDSLRHQLNIDRSTISKSAAELRRFTECQQDQDPLVNPVDKRVNPWAEKSKCEIL